MLGGVAFVLGVGDVVVLDVRLLPRLLDAPLQAGAVTPRRSVAAPGAAAVPRVLPAQAVNPWSRPLAGDPVQPISLTTEPRDAAPSPAGSQDEPLCSVFFGTGEITVGADGRGGVTECAARWHARPEPLVLVGHTDDLGPRRRNRWLGEQRAWAVVWALEARGVPPRQIRRVQSVVDDATGENRIDAATSASHRRVDVWFLKIGSNRASEGRGR